VSGCCGVEWYSELGACRGRSISRRPMRKAAGLLSMALPSRLAPRTAYLLHPMPVLADMLTSLNVHAATKYCIRIIFPKVQPKRECLVAWVAGQHSLRSSLNVLPSNMIHQAPLWPCEISCMAYARPLHSSSRRAMAGASRVSAALLICWMHPCAQGCTMYRTQQQPQWHRALTTFPLTFPAPQEAAPQPSGCS
jgi:hypothetical protein